MSKLIRSLLLDTIALSSNRNKFVSSEMINILDHVSDQSKPQLIFVYKKKGKKKDEVMI